MTWKDWPEWKKRGVLFFNIGCMVYMTRWFLYVLFENAWFSLIFKIILIIVGFPVMWFIPIFYEIMPIFLAYILDITLNLACWFALGAFIGFKIKSSKKSKLYNYIKEHLNKDYPKSALLAHLQDHGYKQEEISKTIKKIEKDNKNGPILHNLKISFYTMLTLFILIPFTPIGNHTTPIVTIFFLSVIMSIILSIIQITKHHKKTFAFISLITTIGIILLFSMWGVNDYNENTGNCNDFPDLINDSSVSKTISTESSYCLIHIRQIHYVSGMDGKGLNEVLKVQDNIYDILKHLIEEEEITTIYGEGITKNIESKIPQLGMRFFGLGYRREPDKKPSEYVKNIDPDKKYNSDELYYDLGYKESVRAIYESHYIDLRAAEHYIDENFNIEEKMQDTLESINGTIQNCIHLREKIKNKELTLREINQFEKECDETKLGDSFLEQIKTFKEDMYEINDPREDALLENLVKEKSSGRFVVVFGGAHNWTNNIIEWNQRNPHYKFSLIEITPNTYNDAKNSSFT